MLTKHFRSELFDDSGIWYNIFLAIVLRWRPLYYAHWPSPRYSCGKRNPLYPIQAISSVSMVLYLIHNQYYIQVNPRHNPLGETFHRAYLRPRYLSVVTCSVSQITRCHVFSFVFWLPLRNQQKKKECLYQFCSIYYEGISCINYGMCIYLHILMIFVSWTSNMTGATCGAGTAYPSDTTKFIPGS
jgi:hypothetical protein